MTTRTSAAVETGARDQVRLLAATMGPVLEAADPPSGGRSRGQDYSFPRKTRSHMRGRRSIRSCLVLLRGAGGCGNGGC